MTARRILACFLALVLPALLPGCGKAPRESAPVEVTRAPSAMAVVMSMTTGMMSPIAPMAMAEKMM